MSDELDRAAEKIASADALLVTAGAGMGVDSGLPDFRGTEGFWRAYPVAAKLGLRFAELANPGWFDQRPGLAWAFYGHRLNLYRRTQPHDGFAQLFRIARMKRLGYFVFTSNVDGHFQQAGFASEKVVECHGSIHHFQCSRPCTREIWDATDEQVQVDEPRFKAIPPLPKCPHCGAVARPNILMFGDSRWIFDRTAAQEQAFEQWLLNVKNSDARLVVIELGAGTAIPTVRRTSEQVAAALGATLIRINPREAEIPAGGVPLRMGAKEALTNIIATIRSTQ